MSSFASSAGATNVCSSQSRAIRNISARSVGQPASLLDQPFVISPGFSPVPAKIVAQIVAGKYIALNKMLAVNLLQKESEPQLLFDGRLVLTSQPKKQRRKIEDVASWMEAFSIFALILVTHFPHRWKDLLQYQLLTLRTFCHFSGQVWLAYNQAFCEHAAATHLTDWSCMNVQLFNFHAAGLWNKPSAFQNPKVIDDYLAHEVSRRRVAGPFPSMPIPNMQTSSFGVIPKKGQPGKWRLIVDLSSPGGYSVNDGISADEFSMHYIKLDQSIRMVAKHGPNSSLT